MDDRDKWKLEMLEDELRERERRPRRSSIFDSLTIPQAIVFAAIILVAGGWIGKLVHDEIQARKFAAAMDQIGREFSNAFRTTSKPSPVRSNLEERIRQQNAVNQQRIDQRAAEQQLAAEQARKEKLLKSDNCQFWMRMDEQQSTKRTREKRAESCT